MKANQNKMANRLGESNNDLIMKKNIQESLEVLVLCCLICQQFIALSVRQ